MTRDYEIKALLFDVFGTVVDWRSGIIRELSAWGTDTHVVADWPAIADGWRGLYQPAMERIRAGNRGFVRLDILHEENLRDIFAEHGLDAPIGEEMHRLVTAWHRLDPWPDCVSGLTRLKASYVIAPCSNGNIALITNMAKRAGLPWDVVLGAEVAQAYKPHAQAYLGSADALSLKPEQCMMVAAHLDDLEAAAELGFATAYVPRPDEHGKGTGAKTAPDGSVDHVAIDFNALAENLDC
ncbi:MAG: haloacid dehalogenase type II [Anderseniella sp.]|nr:haloacid dehalogenase type II [Anderseniella sp.]